MPALLLPPWGKSLRLRQLGAAFTFNPQNSRWRPALKTALAPRRVDLASDSIGGKLLPEVIDTLADLGKVSLVARLAQGPMGKILLAVGAGVG